MNCPAHTGCFEPACTPLHTLTYPHASADWAGHDAACLLSQLLAPAEHMRKPTRPYMPHDCVYCVMQMAHISFLVKRLRSAPILPARARDVACAGSVTT